MVILYIYIYIYIYRDKHIFVQKNVYKWTKLVFAMKSLSGKYSPCSLSGKEKIPGSGVGKESHVDSILGTITINSLEKETTVNSDSYCHLLWQNSPYRLNDFRGYIYTYIYRTTLRF